jgi:hypothetical protein
MSSNAKRAKKRVLSHNRAVVRQFAEWVNVCNFSVRFKVAIRILRAKL